VYQNWEYGSLKNSQRTYLKIILLTLHVPTWPLAVVVNDFSKCVWVCISQCLYLVSEYLKPKSCELIQLWQTMAHAKLASIKNVLARRVQRRVRCLSLSFLGARAWQLSSTCHGCGLLLLSGFTLLSLIFTYSPQCTWFPAHSLTHTKEPEVDFFSYFLPAAQPPRSVSNN